MKICWTMFAAVLLGLAGQTLQADEPAAAKSFPPGWLPVQQLDEAPLWSDFRKIDDRVHLYLPFGERPVRGVFVCYVFHSSDPRELARLWNFALVTIPWPFEYDLGHNDQRNGRFKLGHPPGNMGLLLDYLGVAGRQLSHPELATVPIVGWLGQNGAKLCHDLFTRAPERVLAWGDAWYPEWPKYPELVAQVPVASAWEFSNEAERRAERQRRLDEVADKPTPAPDLRCYATTYGFGHGIYSKYNFFVAYIDRCIRLRMPDVMPPPGQPVALKPVDRTQGWAGDFNEIGQWNAIASCADARGMIAPTWLPDEYAAWTWRVSLRQTGT